MKKIIITGTSRGIGKSIALYHLKKKIVVIGIGRRHTIKDKNYIPITQDLNNFSGYKEKIENLLKEYKDILAVISNAGSGLFNNLENFSDKQIQEYFNLNLVSHILLSKIMFLILKKRMKDTSFF